MYTLRIDDGFTRSYRKLTKAEQKAVDKKLFILADNPWHRSLRVKKIQTTAFFECSVNMDIRIAFLFQEDKLILLLDVGHHDTLISRTKRRD